MKGGIPKIISSNMKEVRTHTDGRRGVEQVAHNGLQDLKIVILFTFYNRHIKVERKEKRYYPILSKVYLGQCSPSFTSS